MLGKKAGWLEVVDTEYISDGRKSYYHCSCECGKDFKVRSDNFVKFVEGKTNSEVCLKCFHNYKPLPDETFKWIPETRYAVSSDGRVWSGKREKFLKVTTDSQGFGVVHVGKGNGLVKLHRLLAELFVPNPHNLPYVRFKDDNPSNITVDNLEWFSNMEQLAGKRFGKLVATANFTRKVGNYGTNVILWKCLCDCGNTVEVLSGELASNHVKSCGCLKSEVLQERNFKHGLSHTPEYKTWIGIRDRCNNLNSISAKDYAARGIIVEEPWSSSFEAFLEDMGTKPSQSHTIERVDVNGNYCKENCIWTDDRSLQAYNQRMKSSNTSGRTGVSFYDGRWHAIICGEYIMSTTDYDKALAAREAAEIERFGFNKE